MTDVAKLQVDSYKLLSTVATRNICHINKQ
jgi:hypothetical protein